MKKEKLWSNEALTIEKIIKNQKIAGSHRKQVYGKYGILAKQYLEQHNQGKLLGLVGELPEYLHNIDKQAEELYEVMFKNLSSMDEFKRTGNYLEDAKKIRQMQSIIDEVIMNQLVYEKD